MSSNGSTDQPKPKRPGVVPSIYSPDCEKHIQWITTVFSGKEEMLFRTKDEKSVIHCSLELNGGYLYLSDRSCSQQFGAVESGEPRGFVLHVEVEDPNIFWKKALSNGANVIEELKMQFWGSVYGSFKDPFGFPWAIMKGGKNRKPGVVPYLLTEPGNCEKHIEWLQLAFGGVVKDKFIAPESDGGNIQFCEVAMKNGGCVYLADQVSLEQQNNEVSGTPVHIVCHMDVPDPKSLWDTSIEKGAKSVADLKVQFWGDLYGVFKDVMGFDWSLSKPSSSDSASATPPHPKAVGVVPYIMSPDCDKHIEWVKNVMKGEVIDTIRTDDKKKVMHCCMTVNKGRLFLCDRSCNVDGGSENTGEDSADTTSYRQGTKLHMNVPDPDEIWKRAMANGAVQEVELKKQFWGDYYGSFHDPFGFEWAVLKQ